MIWLLTIGILLSSLGGGLGGVQKLCPNVACGKIVVFGVMRITFPSTCSGM
ncbi:hypothetical protein [Neobacillus citreus]|uniref:Uncharacterized protein n=1 Tax=Neobacillus citreus TaxID=2833578 RepID=A0A9J6MLK9_9BACI|nr:hypothetical protein [Neobacillus citreus]MCH6264888.1 hypothetical protein [Neobacillus citreus]